MQQLCHQDDPKHRDQGVEYKPYGDGSKGDHHCSGDTKTPDDRAGEKEKGNLRRRAGCPKKAYRGQSQGLMNVQREERIVGRHAEVAQKDDDRTESEAASRVPASRRTVSAERTCFRPFSRSTSRSSPTPMSRTMPLRMDGSVWSASRKWWRTSSHAVIIDRESPAYSPQGETMHQPGMQKRILPAL